MKVKKQRTKKLRVVIIAIFLVIGVCGLVLLNGNTEIELSKFTAQIVKAFGDTSETVLSQWDISASSDDSVTATLYGDGRLVISGTGDMLYDFDDQWGTYKDEIKSVIIQDGVKNIGQYAFKACYNLSSVDMPESLTHIESDAFYECKSLQEIIIPQNVIGMGYGIFDYCINLKNINVDTNNQNYKSIDGVLFNKEGTQVIRYPEGKENTEYSIPNGVLGIEVFAFINCSNLENIIIPDSVSCIGQWAFVNCSNLNTINLPKNITIIEERTFYSCENLESINISGNITSVGEMAFYECERLADITLPDSVTNIGAWAFSDCKSLQSISLPSGVKNLESGVFARCTNLKNISLSNNITSIGERAFFECSSLTSMNVPSSVTAINDYAFSSCTGLTDIKIPINLESIGSHILDGSKITINSENQEVMPEIMKRVLDENDILYAEEIEVTNCEYIEEKNVFKINESSASIEVKEGTLEGLIIKINLVDAPETKITKSTDMINELAIGHTLSFVSNQSASGYTNENIVFDVTISEIDYETEVDIDTLVNSLIESVGEENAQSVIDGINNGEICSLEGFPDLKNFKIIMRDADSGEILKQVDFSSEINNNSLATQLIVEQNCVIGIEGIISSKIEFYDSEGNVNMECSWDDTYTSENFLTINQIDKILPTITISPNGATISQSQTIIITAEDKGVSGLNSNNSYQYQLGTNNTEVPTGTWQDYTSGTEFAIGEGLTGDYYIWVKNISDNAGNDAAESDYIVSNQYIFGDTIKDTIEPTINSVTGNATEWTNQSVTLTINATDNESGIAGYSFDNGENWQTTNSKTYTGNTDGIIIKVKDNEDNVATYAQTINIDKIDTTDATISSVSGNATAWTNGNVTLTINATDSESGIAEYSFDDGENWQTTNSKRYTANTSDIKIKVKDNAGNITPYGETIKIDKIDTTDATINSVNGNATVWTNGNVTLTINATDSESGIAEYSFDDGENWQTTNSKRYTANTSDIKIKVKDNAGNITSYGETIKIDKIDTTDATINSVSGNAIAWTNGNVTLTINATDDESGIAGYSFDDGENWQTTNSKAYTGNTNEIKIKVKDNAGNITPYGETIKIDKIDKTAPTITITPNGSNTSQNKEVIINVVDLGGSGLSNENSYQYQLGTSSTEVPTGTWQDYTNGTGFTIGEGLTGNYYIWVKNISDNAGNEAAELDYIVSNKFMFDNSEDADITVPELSVEYSTTQLTKESVTVTIKSNEEIQEVDGWTISEDDKTLTKVYTKNATENIDVYDIAGNKTTIQVKIENIDTTVPELSVEYSTTQLTNQSVTVTIKSNEEIQEVDGWTISEDDKTLTKTYATNSNQNVDVYDIVGNKSTIQVKVENIDTTKPELSVEYDITQPTNKSVTATITANEQIQQLEGWTISEDGTTLTKIYTENTEKNIDVYDLAGNKSIVQVKITNIDKTEIKATVEYSTTILTNKNVIVKIISNKEIKEIDGWTLLEDKKTLTKEYAENSNEDVILQDLVGNEREIKISVQNIDKIAPKVDVEYSTLKQTNKSLTVTITANEDLKSLEGWTLEEDGKTLTKIYTKNTTENIDLYDLAGNKVTVKITINNIDTTLPNIEVKYSTTENTKEDVVVTIVSDEQLQEVDGWTISEDGKTLTKKYEKNVEETIKIYDIAGNEYEVQISVKNIDKTTTQKPEVEDTQNSEKPDTAPSRIPDAGSNTLIGIIIITIIVSIVLWIKNRKFKDIK